MIRFDNIAPLSAEGRALLDGACIAVADEPAFTFGLPPSPRETPSEAEAFRNREDRVRQARAMLALGKTNEEVAAVCGLSGAQIAALRSLVSRQAERAP